ncbi:MAG: lytic murein transglycosylase, partial [Myxococcota bacterium]
HQGPGEDVPIEAAVAIWTIESALGNYMGTENPFSQLASRAFRDESRNTDYAAQLRDALVLVERGMLAPDAQSSNAGALGHTQFMPSSWLDLAVDGDHDGQVDLIGSPEDALASTRRYLDLAGNWVADQPPALEVRLPDGFDLAMTGFAVGDEESRTVAQWQDLGVEFRSARPLDPDWRADVVLPEGAEGPALAAFENFSAFRSYNLSDNYAWGASHLTMELLGEPLDTQWVNAPGLFGADAARRREYQELVGTFADGRIGRGSQAATQELQEQRDWGPSDGFADEELLEHLRDELYVVESHLSSQGFLSGAPDRRLDDATRAAVRSYAEQHGLEPQYRAVANHVLADPNIVDASELAPAPSTPDPGWRTYVDGLRTRLLGQGVSASAFDRVFGPDGPAFDLDESVVRLQQRRNQTEFNHSTLAYI